MAKNNKPLGIRQSKEPLPEHVGTTGFFTMSGYLQTEYLPDLKGVNGLNIYTKMLASDGMAKAIFKSIYLPLLNASWYIEPSDPDNEEAVLLAKKVENNLLYGMKNSWRNFVYQVLLSLVYGFYVFECDWKRIPDPAEDEFHVQINEFCPRHSPTIRRWLHDESGNIKYVEQWAYFNKSQKNNIETAEWKQIPIPYENCLHFINESEDGNYEGTSIFRCMYKHWKIKGDIENIENIGAEKMALGMLVVRPPENYKDMLPEQQKQIDDAAIELIENYRVHHNAGIYAPYGMILEILEGKMNSAALDTIVKRHDAKMAQSALAGFLLAIYQTGSYALNKNQTDFFLLAENGIALDICDTFNKQFMPKLVDYNQDGVTKYPRLCVKNIAVTTDQVKEEDKQATQNEKDASPDAVPVVVKKEGFSEQIKLSEHKHTQPKDKIDYTPIKKQMSKISEELKEKLTDITKKQIKAIKSQLSEGKSIDKIIVPFQGDIEKAWIENLENLEFSSIGQIEKEFNSNSFTDKEKIKEAIKVKAKLLTQKNITDLLLNVSNYQLSEVNT